MKRILACMIILTSLVGLSETIFDANSVISGTKIYRSDGVEKPIDYGPSIAECLKIQETRLDSYVAVTNIAPNYVIQSRYGGAWMTFSSNTISQPCFWIDTLKNYTIHTAPRYKKNDILYALAPKDYPYYEKKVLIFEIKEYDDNTFQLKEVKFTEMR